MLSPGQLRNNLQSQDPPLKQNTKHLPLHLLSCASFALWSKILAYIFMIPLFYGVTMSLPSPLPLILFFMLVQSILKWTSTSSENESFAKILSQICLHCWLIGWYFYQRPFFSKVSSSSVQTFGSSGQHLFGGGWWSKRHNDEVNDINLLWSVQQQ